MGTLREPLCIQTSFYSFIGPNNGIFDFVLQQEKKRTVYKISEHYSKDKPNTFHGRDLFAPAAVDWYKGNKNSFEYFDEEKIVHLQKNNQIVAAYIDSYGNIKTNQSIDTKLQFGSFITITTNNKQQVIPFVKTFKDVPVGHLLCYAGSNNTLEIAVNQGSAARQLQITVGDSIEVKR